MKNYLVAYAKEILVTSVRAAYIAVIAGLTAYNTITLAFGN